MIGQAEIFPVLVSKDTWKDHLFGCSILWFLDYDAARAALIRNFSPVMDNFFLLQLNSKMDTMIQTRHWYNRVPSKSSLLVFDVDVDLVVAWKILIDASNPASSSPGSARVFMNAMWLFAMLAMSSMPNHTSTSPHFSAAIS